MPFLLFEQETDVKAKVTLIHYKPDDPDEGLPDEIKARGIYVSELPEPPELQKGKQAVLYCNPSTGETWYEMFDRPLTIEEQLAEQAELTELLLQMQLEKEGIL